MITSMIIFVIINREILPSQILDVNPETTDGSEAVNVPTTVPVFRYTERGQDPGKLAQKVVPGNGLGSGQSGQNKNGLTSKMLWTKNGQASWWLLFSPFFGT
jgi:hypothetical protein